MTTKKRARIVKMAAHAAAVSIMGSIAWAEDFNWTDFSGGTHDWTDPAKWDAAGYPENAGDTANLSGPLADDLIVNIGSDVSISGLTLGATGTPFTTTIGSTGGMLIFDPASTANSVGAAGASNILDVSISLAGNLTLADTSTNSLTFNGGIFQQGGNRQILNNIGGGNTVTLAGDIQLFELTGDPPETQTARAITIRGSGHTIITGSFIPGAGSSQTGQISLGQTSNNDPRSLITLSGSNPGFTRETLLLRAVVILADDYAVGTGQFRSNTANSNFLSEIHSDNDDRALKAQLGIVRPTTVAGDHSLTLDNGIQGRSDSQPLVNLLPDDKTLTVNGTVFLWNNNTENRGMLFDGTGTTVINALVLNNNAALPAGDATSAPFTKRGTGTLVLNHTESTYRGPTNVQGGLLVFGASDSTTDNATWGQTSGIDVSAGGTVGMAQGSADVNYSNFLGKISGTSEGALALPDSDSGLSLDFTSGPLAALSSMSVGAQGNVTYTGTITPGAGGYRLGGGGTLTLPNNQLTGANNVTVTNGGTVVVGADNSYTGSTTVAGNVITSDQLRAITRSASGGTNQMLATTTLSIEQLADAGAPSRLGASSNAASNLVFDGGTLQITGAGGGTDRLFTIGANGAAIDSSGTGAVQFTNTGDIVSDGAGNRTLTLTGSNTGNNTLAGALSDAGADTLALSKTGSGIWILTGNNTHSGGTTVNAGTLQVGSVNALAGGGLAVGGAGLAVLNPGLGAPVQVSSLDIESGGTVNVANNTLVVADGDAAAIRAQLIAGRGGAGGVATWTGTGINSTSAAASPSTRALGYRVDGGVVTVKYTVAGDANLDGGADVSDKNIWNDNKFQTGKIWSQADFNYDGNVDVSDLNIWNDNKFTSTGGTLGTLATTMSAGSTLSAHVADMVYDLTTGELKLVVSDAGLVQAGFLVETAESNVVSAHPENLPLHPFNFQSWSYTYFAGKMQFSDDGLTLGGGASVGEGEYLIGLLVAGLTAADFGEFEYGSNIGTQFSSVTIVPEPAALGLLGLGGLVMLRRRGGR